MRLPASTAGAQIRDKGESRPSLYQVLFGGIAILYSLRCQTTGLPSD